jgi:hypothetical protein
MFARGVKNNRFEIVTVTVDFDEAPSLRFQQESTAVIGEYLIALLVVKPDW